MSEIEIWNKLPAVSGLEDDAQGLLSIPGSSRLSHNKQWLSVAEGFQNLSIVENATAQTGES